MGTAGDAIPPLTAVFSPRTVIECAAAALIAALPKRCRSGGKERRRTLQIAQSREELEECIGSQLSQIRDERGDKRWLSVGLGSTDKH